MPVLGGNKDHYLYGDRVICADGAGDGKKGDDAMLRANTGQNS